MFPVEHGEKVISPLTATGLIKNLELALQELRLGVSGQQEVVPLHPSAHYVSKLSTLVTSSQE